MEAAKKTPLYSQHVQSKAKIVDFGGWSMPVSYESVLAEHKTVRSTVGIFDVSHMGEIRIKGPQAAEFASYLLTNDVHKLQTGQGLYSAMCNEEGGFVDDLILYKLEDDDFFLCVNASNTEKDFAWIQKQDSKFPNLKISNESQTWAQIAIQGPQSLEALTTVLDIRNLSTLEYMHILSLPFQNDKILVARTGYTGEKGFEVYLPSALAEKFWTELLEKNQGLSIKPIGLGARDTLRLEACYLLYGNDMDANVSPLEAGIAWAVKFDHDFIGKEALLKQKEKGLSRKIFAFQMLDSGIPRHGMDVLQNGKRVGTVQSGSVLPSVGGAGGMALIDLENFDPKAELLIDIRGQMKRANTVSKPLYKPQTK